MYRSYIYNRESLFPARLDENIEDDAPVRIVNDIIDSLDIRSFDRLYSWKGRRAYHPKMMLKAVVFGYMNNVFSCRRIESRLKRDIHFMWLCGNERPDHKTINSFRNRVKDEINRIFTQIVLLLADRGFVSLDVEYIDGTKIESRANKYTFVWRKTAERNRGKVLEKIRILLEQIDEEIARENAASEEKAEFTPAVLTQMISELRESLEQAPQAQDKEAKKVLKEKKRQVKELEEHRDKLAMYDGYLEKMEGRNSISKTDTDATFMRMKEDAMRNGQTKPGYNLQISAENQFITDFMLFPNPTDTLTMIPFLESMRERYGKFASTIVADSGYGSEENYHFMEEAGMDAYVKYNWFHRQQRPRYKVNPFHPEGMYYNEREDYYVCPMGQHMERIGTRRIRTDSGYVTESARYRAKNCKGCPLRCLCYKSRADRRIMEVNHQLDGYRKKARELLTSEEGIRHRGRRCIEPEAVFGQIKTDMGYKRFRHFGKDKVTMDFAFLAIAFNLKKLCSKMARMTKNGDNGPTNGHFSQISAFKGFENRKIWKNTQKAVA